MFTLNDIIITDITQVFTVFSPKGRRTTIKNRASFGLSFCKEGQITYTHNGKTFVSDKEHAVILPKGQTYTLHGDKKGEFTVTNFECEHFACSTVKVIPIQNVQTFIKEFEQMKSLSLFDGNRTKIISIFYNTIYRLLSNTALPSPLAAAMRYIGEKYQSTELDNESIAAECNISEVYLRKLFLSHLNTTPRQFIIDLRMQKAKQLLSEGNIKINAVAESCGFSNPYHFCRVFKEKTGMTPSDYAKQNIIYKI